MAKTSGTSDSTSSSSANSPTHDSNTSNPNAAAIALNHATREPISFNSVAFPLKLTPTNYPSWKTQFTCLIVGYDLLGFLDGTNPCPMATEPTYALWARQDQLLRHALITSERLQNMHHDGKFVSEYLRTLKAVADELGPEFREIAASLRTRDTSLSFDDLHDRLVAHEESLHREDTKLESTPFTAHFARVATTPSSSVGTSVGLLPTPHNGQFFTPPPRNYRGPLSSNRPFSGNRRRGSFGRPNNRPTAQACQLRHNSGHFAHNCPFYRVQQHPPHANFASSPNIASEDWLLDSGATHHVTTDLANLALHSEYLGPDELQIGDGIGLKITHVGDTTLPTSSTSFPLRNVLCVPSASKNLISVSQLCKHTNAIVEFHPDYFLVKDRSTGATMLRGPNIHGVYKLLSKTKPVALVGECVSLANWHAHLVLIDIACHRPAVDRSMLPPCAAVPHHEVVPVSTKLAVPHSPASPTASTSTPRSPTQSPCPTSTPTITPTIAELDSSPPLSSTHATFDALPLPPPSLPMHTHPMVTHSQNNIFKPKSFHHATMASPLPSPEPTCVSQALKDFHWRRAMSEEFNALIRQGTWELVPYHPNQHVLGCKWIFQIKRGKDGSIAHYKACLVAKGFHQRPGSDYLNTFSPVIKPTTIWTVLSLIVSSRWPLKQLDVNNAFLHGELDEELYMQQPAGFIDQNHPSHVCRLRKSIYGLKQAPRAWFRALKDFLLSQGFFNSKSDSSLFIFNRGSVVVFFLVYVDDIIVIGNNLSFITSLIQTMGHRFSLKEPSDLSYFLRIEVVSVNGSLFLSQHRYIQDLLQKSGMTEAKPVATPLASTSNLLLNTSVPLTDVVSHSSCTNPLMFTGRLLSEFYTIFVALPLMESFFSHNNPTPFTPFLMQTGLGTMTLVSPQLDTLFFLVGIPFRGERPNSVPLLVAPPKQSTEP
ncbi:hypothetical protein SLEP1_g49115 [Rubroshorea leprosula]|uniref:Reverse transcriptase Ty1/copia-type domain-containing protein n=1 Tax=Rubroshorea leprosula TaxID=152421 RepID=A0AAV5LWZ6_9ROSI|nr:hypothetical protein SLEP1_g49115 [Rubroshorea leprosula]